MPLDWRVMVIGLMLVGCTQADTSVSHRDILDDYKALNLRLDQLSHPLLAANHDICEQTVEDDGIRWHQLNNYPEDLQPVAQSYWGVDVMPSVFYVFPGSAADLAGIKAGDRPSEATVENLKTTPICHDQVQVSYIGEINAYATGAEIIVTSGMLRSIEDDQYLTLVLAHELSHNILDHIENPTEADMETEADEAAVKLMARAGLDFEEAIKRRTAHQVKSAKGSDLSEYEANRIESFGAYSQAVKSRQQKGEPLWP